eukprot:756778-Hanusia_phi.AAC.5
MPLETHDLPPSPPSPQLDAPVACPRRQLSPIGAVDPPTVQPDGHERSVRGEVASPDLRTVVVVADESPSPLDVPDLHRVIQTGRADPVPLVVEADVRNDGAVALEDVLNAQPVRHGQVEDFHRPPLHPCHHSVDVRADGDAGDRRGPALLVLVHDLEHLLVPVVDQARRVCQLRQIPQVDQPVTGDQHHLLPVDRERPLRDEGTAQHLPRPLLEAHHVAQDDGSFC